jgi:hypothetical protein
MATEQLRNELKNFRTKLFQATVAGFIVEAEHIKENSMAACPVAPDGGTLRASHEIVGPVKDGRDLVIWIQAGGPADDYAQAVHEHMSEHSPPSWIVAEIEGSGIKWNVPGTGPKFLENAARAALPGMRERVTAYAKARMGL